MQKINWVDRVTNDQVLRQVNEQRKMIDTIKMRRLKWLGHTFRHDSPIQLVLERIIPGKKGRGRPSTNYISQTCGELGLKYIDIKWKIEDRVEWRRFVGRYIRIPVGRLNTLE